MWKRILKYLIGAVTIVTLVIGTQIVTAETGLIVKLPKPITNIASELGQSFTLGMVGVAYATTPDYICDGVADDIEIQAAMNALPATGGELFFFGGNFVLTATVTRAINNISIVGSGYSTYFANDGGTAIFSNGAQTGWQFEDFRTDAGWLTLATACTVKSVWDNTYYVDSTVGVGGTLPTHPRTGQQWLHTPTGRTVLMQYDGTDWYPMRSYGITTLYVDATDGTDDVNYGYAVDAGAFKTLTYVCNFLHMTITGDVNVYFSAETYADSVEITGITTSGTGTVGTYPSIFFHGTLVVHDALTATGVGVKGTTSTQASFVDNVPLVDHHYNNQILNFTSGANNGLYRIIDHNDTTTITLAGRTLSAQPQIADTATVYDWGTQFSGTIICGRGQQSVVFDKIYFSSSCTFHAGAIGQVQYCKFQLLQGNDCSKVWAYDCIYSYPAAYGILSDAHGIVFVAGGKIHTSDIGIYTVDNSYVLLYGGVVISGCNTGFWVSTSSVGRCTAPDVYNDIHDNVNYGIRAQQGGQVYDTAYNDYAANGTNESAVAASFGYID